MKWIKWTCGACGEVQRSRVNPSEFPEVECGNCGLPTAWGDLQRWCEHGVPVWHRRCPECDRYEHGDMQRDERRLFG